MSTTLKRLATDALAEEEPKRPRLPLADLSSIHAELAAVYAAWNGTGSFPWPLSVCEERAVVEKPSKKFCVDLNVVRAWAKAHFPASSPALRQAFANGPVWLPDWAYNYLRTGADPHKCKLGSFEASSAESILVGLMCCGYRCADMTLRKVGEHPDTSVAFMLLLLNRCDLSGSIVDATPRIDLIEVLGKRFEADGKQAMEKDLKEVAQVLGGWYEEEED
jgi:hypothetical protein